MVGCGMKGGICKVPALLTVMAFIRSIGTRCGESTRTRTLQVHRIVEDNTISPFTDKKWTDETGLGSHRQTVLLYM